MNTKLFCWTVFPHGRVEVVLMKQQIDGNGQVRWQEPHTCAIDPDSDVEGMIAATNAILTDLGCEELKRGQWDEVVSQIEEVRQKPAAIAWLESKAVEAVEVVKADAKVAP